MGELSGKVVIEASRIVVVMPNWLGDGVMATPFLRGLRGVYPGAHVAGVARGLVAPVVTGLVDEVKVAEKGEEGEAVRWMRLQKFELGILLPNSFRSAWVLWRGGVKRRLGYARGGRGWLLTDRVRAIRKITEQKRRDKSVRVAISLLQHEEEIGDGELVRVEMEEGKMFPRAFAEHRMRSTGKIVRSVAKKYPNDDGSVLLSPFQPVPTIEYYLELVRYLKGESGLSVQQPAPLKTAGLILDEAGRAERRMGLGVMEGERGEAEGALREMGIGEGEKMVVMVPGANFGGSKCWMPERFAEVAERLADGGGGYKARVILAGSPAEMAICEAILKGVGEKSREAVHVLGAVNGGKGVGVGALKEIVRRSRLMICNDTGPRHFAVAFGVPVVTLFGPTDPVWAETYFEKERIVRVEVPCGPCQLKVCPIDHRCMKGITVERVMGEVAALWAMGDKVTR